MTRLSLFAAAPPGLEPITRTELLSLGINHPRAVAGGVEFAGFLTHLYRVNLWSRTASRVLVRLGEFHAISFPELRRKAANLPWEAFLHPGQQVSIRVTCHKSRLYHSDAVAERIAGAIEDRLGAAPAPPPNRAGQPGPAEEEEGSGIVVRLHRDQCTVSLDSSGTHLHRRGYRRQTAKAPLRETLAAALLIQAGYDPSRPLLDPFCGSGTFAVEAALIASRTAPGGRRRFAFMNWPNFDGEDWANQLQRAADSVLDAPAPIHASDRDAGAVAAAAANAERAGVAGAIRLRTCALSAVEPPAEAGLLIGNPPYGRRAARGGGDVRNLYAQLGNVARARCAGWRVAVLAGSLPLARATGLAFGPPLWVDNGGLRVPFLMTPSPVA